MRAHVINDTEELVRCAPGTKRDGIALLQSDLDLVCEPHAEIGFLFAVPRFGSSSRSAFVRVGGTTFACGFDAPIEDETLRLAAIAIAAGALVLALVAGIVLYQRSRGARPSPPRDEDANEVVTGEFVDEPQAQQPAARPPAVPETARSMETHGIEARGFAAVLDDERVVMGVLELVERRFFSTEFVAKIVNQTQEPVLCSLTARTRRGSSPIAPGSFRIHPHSAAAVDVLAPIRVPWRLRTLHLRMESSSLSASAQADVPVPLGVRIALGVACAVFAAAIAFLVFRSVRPAIAGFAVPTRVLAGSTATASYALSGIGTGHYDVTAGNRHIAGGTVGAGSGSFTFSTLNRPAAYRVALVMTGPFGSAQTMLSLASVAHLAPATASIGGLAVDPSVAAAGAPVVVRYDANGDTGSISLVGAAGIALERAAYAQSGTATLRAPQVNAPTQYQIALDVTRLGSSAHASVGLLVLPHALATPPSASTEPAGLLTVAQLMRVEPSRVVSARRFNIVLLAHPANLTLMLQDAKGATVEERTVFAGATSVRMLAPRVQRRTRYVIVARFTTGNADQALLEPLTIYSR